MRVRGQPKSSFLFLFFVSICILILMLEFTLTKKNSIQAASTDGLAAENTKEQNQNGIQINSSWLQKRLRRLLVSASDDLSLYTGTVSFMLRTGFGIFKKYPSWNAFLANQLLIQPIMPLQWTSSQILFSDDIRTFSSRESRQVRTLEEIGLRAPSSHLYAGICF